MDGHQLLCFATMSYHEITIFLLETPMRPQNRPPQREFSDNLGLEKYNNTFDLPLLGSRRECLTASGVGIKKCVRTKWGI